MFEKKRHLVYCSKDGNDWEKAKSLLKDAKVTAYAWHTQEPAVAGCGAKIDIRTFGSSKEIPKEIYRIEVASEDRERAEGILNGKVLPVIHYGFG